MCSENTGHRPLRTRGGRAGTEPSSDPPTLPLSLFSLFRPRNPLLSSYIPLFASADAWEKAELPVCRGRCMWYRTPTCPFLCLNNPVPGSGFSCSREVEIRCVCVYSYDDFFGLFFDVKAGNCRPGGRVIAARWITGKLYGSLKLPEA